MVTVVLRIQVPDIDPEQLSWLPRERLQRIWKKGEARGGLSVNKASGFSVLLSEHDDPTDATVAASTTLAAIAAPITELVREGARGEVDWGVMIERDATAAQSIRLSPEMLRLVERCGLEAVVSIYPCSD
jgi:hypothetical protein